MPAPPPSFFRLSRRSRPPLAPLVPLVPLVALVALGSLPSCRSSPTRSSEPAKPADEAPQATLAWVDPARCLKPCAHDPPAHVATIDDLGRLSDEGHLRFDRAAQPALQALIAAARAAGHPVAVSSAYRSHDEQAKLYSEANDIGRAARPGHSEHELGLAVDLDFPDDGTQAWLAEHAAEHGFVLSYPDSKQKLTGFRYEPWHFRHVGVSIARALAAKGQTLQEYLREHPGLGVSGDCSDCQAPTSRTSCGPITARGECVGEVLTWCMDGAKAAVDCTTSGRHCRLRDDETGADCL